MIDIHSHILPGLDDGSESLEESVEMLRQGPAAGTAHIAARPHPPMIDTHSHIRPGRDDGSESLEESVEMLRQAAAAGTADIVASPHANQDYAFDPLVVERKIGELQAAVGDAPRIHYGCDFHLTLENIDDALRSPGKYSIDHRGYLLVEFSDFLIPKTTGQIFARMMHVGLRPIVTHPERNQLLQRRLPELEAWVAQGAHLQVTAQSFLGRFGKTAK